MQRPHVPLPIRLTRHAVARWFVVAPRICAEILLWAMHVMHMAILVTPGGKVGTTSWLVTQEGTRVFFHMLPARRVECIC